MESEFENKKRRIIRNKRDKREEEYQRIIHVQPKMNYFCPQEFILRVSNKIESFWNNFPMNQIIQRNEVFMLTSNQTMNKY